MNRHSPPLLCVPPRPWWFNLQKSLTTERHKGTQKRKSEEHPKTFQKLNGRREKVNRHSPHFFCVPPCPWWFNLQKSLTTEGHKGTQKRKSEEHPNKTLQKLNGRREKVNRHSPHNLCVPPCPWWFNLQDRCSIVNIAAALGGSGVLLQKIRDSRICVDLIFDFGEAVAFVLIDLQFRHTIAPLDGAGHLL